MARLDRDGVAIHYEVHGQGPAILLSHGYSATCRMWDGQIAALRDRFQVIVWDMRGHGESDYPTDPAAYSEAATVEDMAAVLHACSIQRAVIGGLSLGGYMSMAFHRVHPAMTRALMIFDTGPGFRNAEAREAWNQRARQRADDLDARGLAALGTSDEVRMSQHRDASGLAGAARGMLTQRDDSVMASLETIAVPSLVLVGSNDTNFLAATDYMARKIPGATKVVIEGAGHAANLHQPAAFNRAVETIPGKARRHELRLPGRTQAVARRGAAVPDRALPDRGAAPHPGRAGAIRSRAVAGDGGDGLDRRRDPRGVRRRRPRPSGGLRAGGGAGPRGGAGAVRLLGVSGHRGDPAVRQRCAEAAVPAEAGGRRGDRHAGHGRAARAGRSGASWPRMSPTGS